MYGYWEGYFGPVGVEGFKFVKPLQYKSRRDMLQEYVKNVQPEFMERFVQKAPAQVDHFCFVAFRAEAVTWRRVLRGSIAVSCLAVLIFVMFFL